MNERTRKAMTVMMCVRQAWLESLALNSKEDPVGPLAEDLVRADAHLWLIFREQSGSDEEANKLMKRTERPLPVKKLPGVSMLFGSKDLSQYDVQISSTGDYYMPGVYAPENIEERLIVMIEDLGRNKVTRISFTIPGSPVGKGRPRVSTWGGRAHAYTPEKTRTYEARVKAVAKAAMKFMGIRQVPLAPVRVSIVARFEWPQGDLNADGSLKEHKPGTKAAARVNDMKYARVVPGKPDIDNVVKAVLDALNGIAYQDDAQVSVLHAAKRWRDCDEEREPGVDVQIEWEE